MQETEVEASTDAEKWSVFTVHNYYFLIRGQEMSVKMNFPRQQFAYGKHCKMSHLSDVVWK